MKNIETFEDLGQAQYDLNDAAVKDAQENASSVNDDMKETINLKNANLMEKNKINVEQEKAIVDKQKLFLTRSRMLQISRDKNAYKLKIIYTLLALIILIFIASLGIFVFLKKGSKSN